MFVSVSCRGLAQLYVCVCMMPRPGITQLYVCVCSMPWSGLTQLYACVCFMPQIYLAVCLCLYHAADKLSRMFVSVSGCGLLSCMFVSVPCLGLTQLYVCVCIMPRPGFPTLYVVVFFMFTDLRSEVIVYFVDIGGIVDHHCLRFLFINKVKTNYFFLCFLEQ
jgi:hypothetical protein